MEDIHFNIRKLVIDTLKLISSKDMQLAYMKEVPIADVSAELFCKWEGAYIRESSVNKVAFSIDEILALENFNNVFNEISDLTPSNLPPIQEFMTTKEWSILSQAARDTLKVIENMNTYS